MTIHLIKLSVGSETVSDLAGWQAQRLKARRGAGQKPELIHITRQTPKRAEELLAGGSIYWVIKGRVLVRQKLLELRPLVVDGVPHCGLVYDPALVAVRPRPSRPFQGWRYLEDAPADLGPWSKEAEESGSLQRELMEMGLL